MVPIRRVKSNGSRRVVGMPSLLKNHLNIYHPRINPEINRTEYHLSSSDPIVIISGLTLQFIANISNIISFHFQRCKVMQKKEKAPHVSCLYIEYDIS